MKIIDESYSQVSNKRRGGWGVGWGVKINRGLEIFVEFNKRGVKRKDGGLEFQNIR